MDEPGPFDMLMACEPSVGRKACIGVFIDLQFFSERFVGTSFKYRSFIVGDGVYAS